jgi:Na+-transporting methylmalonyl-CoA/oxaloacetate decarboxylase gamma subunit
MFDPQDLAKAFEILVIGWGGVFVVLTLIYLSSLVLTKLFPVKKDKK